MNFNDNLSNVPPPGLKEEAGTNASGKKHKDAKDYYNARSGPGKSSFLKGLKQAAKA